MKISHILVPTDFSLYSEKAYMTALAIASKANASITLLHAIEPPYDFASTVESTLEQMKRSCRKRLEEMVKKAVRNEKFKDVHVDSVLVTGASRTAIIEAIDTREADFLVLGSQGSSGLRKKLFGSVASDIALKSSIPVLVVPESEGEIQFNHILFATDYRNSDLESLNQLTNFAKFFESHIHILHVEEEETLSSEISFRGFREIVLEKVLYKDIKFDLYIDKDPFMGLSRYMKNQNIELLALTRYKKTVLKSLLEKNLTRNLSYYSTTPLLVIPGA